MIISPAITGKFKDLLRKQLDALKLMLLRRFGRLLEKFEADSAFTAFLDHELLSTQTNIRWDKDKTALNTYIFSRLFVLDDEQVPGLKTKLAGITELEERYINFSPVEDIPVINGQQLFILSLTISGERRQAFRKNITDEGLAGQLRYILNAREFQPGEIILTRLAALNEFAYGLISMATKKDVKEFVDSEQGKLLEHATSPRAKNLFEDNISAWIMCHDLEASIAVLLSRVAGSLSAQGQGQEIEKKWAKLKDIDPATRTHTGNHPQR